MRSVTVKDAYLAHREQRKNMTGICTSSRILVARCAVVSRLILTVIYLKMDICRAEAIFDAVQRRTEIFDRILEGVLRRPSSFMCSARRRGSAKEKTRE
jgi:hypothetical protein